MIKDVIVDAQKNHADVTYKMAIGFDDVKLENERSERRLATQASENKHELSLQMERGFCDIEKQALKLELESLRRKEDIGTITSQVIGSLNPTLNIMLSSITDLSQQQKLTNSTINFGNGNLTGQSANSNQVRG